MESGAFDLNVRSDARRGTLLPRIPLTLHPGHECYECYECESPAKLARCPSFQIWMLFTRSCVKSWPANRLSHTFIV
jgi:hypothetical protein